MNAHYEEAIKLKIKKYYPKLTSTEKYIANIIDQDPSLLKTRTLDQISRQISVSRTTLYRLIKKIGFDNIFDIKHWIIEKNLEDINNLPLVSDIQQTLVNFDIEDGKELARLFAQAGKIFIFARGLSKPIALSLEGKLLKLKFNARFILWEDYHIYSKYDNPLWIFISISGKSFDQHELETLDLFKMKKSIRFSALAPPLINSENFTYTFNSKTKRDFTEYDIFLPFDLEILCLLVVNSFVKTIASFLAK